VTGRRLFIVRGPGSRHAALQIYGSGGRQQADEFAERIHAMRRLSKKLRQY